MGESTMKYIKRMCAFTLVVVLLYLLICVGFRTYVRKNTNIVFLNEKYTEYDSTEGNFIPFGADNSWYEGDTDYYNLLGLSFSKSDHKRNFIYFNDFIDTFVYKKSSFNLPRVPEINTIDKLILYFEPEEKYITIENKDDIETIVRFLSEFKSSANGQSKSSLVFYAVSNASGGVYRLNESGSLYFANNKICYGYFEKEFLPDNLQNVINRYIINK